MIRRLVQSVAAGILVATLFGGALAVPTALATSTDVDAWIEISSVTPAVGCEVNVGVELRSGGDALAFADVQTALHVDDLLFSADRAMSNEGGIAVLSVDTAGINAGEFTWLDVNVGGVYLTGLSLAIGGDGSCDSNSKLIKTEGSVSYNPAPPAPDPTDVAGSGGSSFWVPTYQQQRGLSCEYASLYIATAAWLNPISEYAFDEIVGWSANPHIGYRGDISGSWGGVDDYGVYAEPLAWALPQVGYVGKTFYGAGSADGLIAHLDAGAPVLVWLSLWGDQSVVLQDDGAPYTVVAGEHVVVAHGYDDSGVYVSDPGTGVYDFYSWSDFMYFWNVLDGMGLAVYPA